MLSDISGLLLGGLIGSAILGYLYAYFLKFAFRWAKQGEIPTGKAFATMFATNLASFALFAALAFVFYSLRPQAGSNDGGSEVLLALVGCVLTYAVATLMIRWQHKLSFDGAMGVAFLLMVQIVGLLLGIRVFVFFFLRPNTLG